MRSNFIQIDDNFYNLSLLCIVSELDSDYEGHVKFYFSNEENVDFPKNFKDTVAYLAGKGIKITAINDSEGAVLEKVFSGYFDEDSQEVTLTYSESSEYTFEYEDKKKVEELLFLTEKFTVENDAEDSEEEDDEDSGSEYDKPSFEDEQDLVDDADDHDDIEDEILELEEEYDQEPKKPVKVLKQSAIIKREQTQFTSAIDKKHWTTPQLVVLAIVISGTIMVLLSMAGVIK